MNTLSLTSKEAQSTLEEIRNAFFDIPFNNTGFQTEMFVIAAQITPARSFRTIGMQLFALIKELQAVDRHRDLNQLKAEEIKNRLETEELSKLVRRELEYELADLQDETYHSDKSINDKLHEFSILYNHFKKLPKYSRQQFEAEERLYYEQNLQRQAMGLSGAKEAIINMVEDIKTIELFEKEFQSLSLEEKEVFLLELTKKIASRPLVEGGNNDVHNG